MTKSTSTLLDQIAANAQQALADSDPIEQLEGLATIAWLLEQALPQVVAAARNEGATWDAIAKPLGTSRQAAWERYGRQ